MGASKKGTRQLKEALSRAFDRIEQLEDWLLAWSAAQTQERFSLLPGEVVPASPRRRL
jgi:hypothetical protein